MAAQPMANVDSLGNFTSILNMFKGSGTTTSSTSSNISSQGINAILAQALGSAQGLSGVAGGQRSAGLYNSSTNQLLINDLLTRTSGELAKQQAGTTTKQKTGPQFNPVSTLGFLAAQKLLGPSLKTLADKTGINGIGDKINNAIFGGGGSTVDSGVASSTESALGPYTSGAALDSSVNLGSGLTSAGIDASVIGGGTADVAGLEALDSAAVGSGADAAGLAALDSGAASEGGALVAGDTGISGLAATGWGALAVAGAADIGQDIKGGDSAQLAGDIIGGLGTGDVIKGFETGNALDSVNPLGEGLLGSIGINTNDQSWVICTELNHQGRLNDKLYQASAQRALQLSQEVMAGYHFWAIPTTKALRTSRVLSCVFGYLAKSRCEYLLGKPRVWGALSVWVGEPICAMIGRHLTHQPNWKELYGG